MTVSDKRSYADKTGMKTITCPNCKKQVFSIHNDGKCSHCGKGVKA